jgi:hypothetical protein
MDQRQQLVSVGASCPDLFRDCVTCSDQNKVRGSCRSRHGEMYRGVSNSGIQIVISVSSDHPNIGNILHDGDRGRILPDLPTASPRNDDMRLEVNFNRSFRVLQSSVIFYQFELGLLIWSLSLLINFKEISTHWISQ